MRVVNLRNKNKMWIDKLCRDLFSIRIFACRDSKTTGTPTWNISRQTARFLISVLTLSCRTLQETQTGLTELKYTVSWLYQFRFEDSFEGLTFFGKSLVNKSTRQNYWKVCCTELTRNACTNKDLSKGGRSTQKRIWKKNAKLFIDSTV
jgi:hypothetical protein